MTRVTDSDLDGKRALNRVLGRNPRIDLYLDLALLVSGLVLIGFLWLHMLFVATVLLGADAFDRLALALDRYYLAQIGIPFIGVAALVHVLVVSRRIPNRFQDFWRHATLVRHPDTWTWIFQVVTAPIIAVLALIHVWVVLADWPIAAVKSAERIDSFLWFYIILLLVGEYHAGTGLYRQFVKWGWLRRRTIGFILKSITLLIIILGLGALWAFLQIGGGA
ncbi:MAG: succinate dehydrogenase [Candidatus Desulforudis sp.]|nr:succinate dehydrogenase [Desulforudis sp.]